MILDPYRYASGAAPLLLDTFDRADAANLGTADTSQVWSGTNFRIVSNAAKQDSGAGAGFKIDTIDPGQADIDLTVHITPNALSGNDLGLVARYTDSLSHILFNIVKDPGGWLCRAFELVAGVGYTGVTTLQNPPAGLTNTYDPFRARIVCDGTAGEVFLTSMADLDTWNSMGTWTINAALTANSVGMVANQSEEVAWNDFRVDAP